MTIRLTANGNTITLRVVNDYVSPSHDNAQIIETLSAERADALAKALQDAADFARRSTDMAKEKFL